MTIKSYRIRLPMLLLTFTCVLIVSLYLSYFMAYGTFKKNEGYFTYNQARVLTNGILSDAAQNYNHIGDVISFSRQILPQLEKLNSTMQIIDTEGQLLFDSRDRTAFDKKIKVDIEDSVHYDRAFESENPGFIKLSFPLLVGGKQLANAVFIMPQGLFHKDASKGNVNAAFIPVLLGSAFCVLMLFMFLLRLSGDLFRPLQALNKSAKEIARGNLDIRLDCDEDSELGDFTKAFDLMREELKDSIQKQREYENSRKELIASISHDIKTPVASIKAYVEGLQDGMAKDPETMERYISVIKKKTDSLSKLVEDLFQHSIRELGKFNINKEEIYSRRFLNQVLESVRVQFDKSPVALEIKEPVPDVLISVDAGRMEQVILNLLQNAKKYTPEGGKIFFTASDEEEFLKVAVKDTGLGISPEDLPFIFDQFYRGEKARSQEFEGTGLGLSICKYIVEEHGGKIFVNSRPNEGSTFIFTIPKA